jgi:hypothetical protein
MLFVENHESYSRESDVSLLKEVEVSWCTINKSWGYRLPEVRE